MKIREIFFACEFVVPTFQTSGLTRLQGYGNPRLTGATSCRKQPILKVNPLEMSKNQRRTVTRDYQLLGINVYHWGRMEF